MDVVALLSDPLLTTLRVTLRHDHRLLTTPMGSGLVDGLRETSADVIVLEPSVVPASEWRELVAFLSQTELPTVVVYTTLAPAALRATLELARLGVRHIVIKGYDDTPRTFRALFEALATEFWSSTLFAQLEPRLRPLPPRLREAMAYLYRAPHRVRSVGELAAVAGTTPRTIHRWLARVELPSAKRLVAAARVEWALALLRSETISVVDVAARLRYAHMRRLRREARLLTDRPPAALQRLDADSLVALLWESVTTRWEDDEDDMAAFDDADAADPEPNEEPPPG